MREWSTYCQTADFLEKSRMLIMNRDMSAQVADWIGIKPGDTVLDVGCGSGELTFYLAKVTENVHYTGVDLDIPFLERANQKAQTYGGSCKLSLLCLALSVVFRRKGYPKTSFFIQFGGVLPIAIIFVLEIIFKFH